MSRVSLADYYKSILVFLGRISGNQTLWSQTSWTKIYSIITFGILWAIGKSYWILTCSWLWPLAASDLYPCLPLQKAPFFARCLTHTSKPRAKGLRIRNPNLKIWCGCGHKFGECMGAKGQTPLSTCCSFKAKEWKGEDCQLAKASLFFLDFFPCFSFQSKAWFNVSQCGHTLNVQWRVHTE